MIDSDAYTINPWHMAAHLWIMRIYKQLAQEEGNDSVWLRAYDRQANAYDTFMRGEKP